MPCIIESPQLIKLKQAGVNIVGVTWMDQPGNTSAFLDRYGNPYSQVLVGGEDSSVEFGITAAPETFIVDSKGMVVDKHVGVVTDEESDQHPHRVDADHRADPARQHRAAGHHGRR